MTPNVSQDAVVVIPGIMGSALRDTTTGQPLWGLRPDWYARAWAGRETLRALMLTDDERAGRIGRVEATGLLRFPAFSPVLAGFEPYTTLCDRIRAMVASPKAVLEFGYDWRLPVAYNASRLAAEGSDVGGGEPADVVTVVHAPVHREQIVQPRQGRRQPPEPTAGQRQRGAAPGAEQHRCLRGTVERGAQRDRRPDVVALQR